MLQSHPDAGQMPGIQRPPPPASILSAVKVMYAGAVAEVLHAVIFFVTQDATKTAIEKSDPSFSAHSVSTGPGVQERQELGAGHRDGVVRHGRLAPSCCRSGSGPMTSACSRRSG